MAQSARHQGMSLAVMGATTLVGDRVVNAKGERLGKIEELMIDMRKGHIAYAVLSFGGILGIGDKLFAIPWSVLRLDPDSRQFIFDVEKESLERAPGFDKDHWPAMADSRWAAQIHSYYKSTPYWM